MVDCDGNAGLGLYGDDGENCSRWPRQETLTLLEIRTRLHPKFKQAAAHKAPLWNEVSRILAEDHGYHRTAKKCKEKLDNLYKYYKKTKSAKGRGSHHNGKHYRFFNQLEALYGENSSTSDHHYHQMPCISTPTHQPQENQESEQEEEFDDTVSTEEEDDWNLKLRNMIETQMRKLMEVQESWLGKTLDAVEQMEQERVYREEAWRREELVRAEQEERLWACERAWIEARDAALVNALEKIGCKCRDAKQLSALLMAEDEEEESTSMYGHDDDNNGKEMKECEAVMMADNDEIAEMIRLQSWVQPELDDHQYHGGSGLAQLR